MSQKAVLVDRDDTLCPDVPYCSDPALIHVYPDVPLSIKRLNDAGYLVLIVTNQSGVGRGYFTLERMHQVNAEAVRQSETEGGKITDVFYCPHAPDDHCSCRKPEIGMGLQAISKYDLDPKQCWMIGDKDKDMEFGKRLGMSTVQVSPQCSFSEAVDTILGN